MRLFSMSCVLWLMSSTPAIAETPTETGPRITIVIGAVGDDEFQADFDQWRTDWNALGEQLDVSVLPDPESDATTKQQLIDVTASQADSERPLWILLLGHGTSDGKTSKFNLVGPDLASDELSDQLEPLACPIVVAACFASSTSFLTDLSADNRTVISATRNASEQNYSRLGGFLSKRLVDADADIDHDGAVSILEAFLAASADVDRFYDEAGRLATEHALIDDNGDSRGTPATFFDGVRVVQKAKQGESIDGLSANRIYLQRVNAESTRPLTADEKAQQEELETAIELLRIRKTDLPETEYYNQLESLLLKLAKLLL